MIFALLDTGKGIITDRAYSLMPSKSAISFSFQGAPEGAAAIFKQGETTFYRDLKKGECHLNASLLSEGPVDICVVVLGTSTKWHCERVDIQRQEELLLIAPDFSFLLQLLPTLLLENQEIRKTCRETKEQYKLLEDKLVRIMEGYDLV